MNASQTHFGVSHVFPFHLDRWLMGTRHPVLQLSRACNAALHAQDTHVL